MKPLFASPCFPPASPEPIVPKLTKRFIDSLRPDPNGSDVFAWNRELHGFAVRMKASGNTSFIVQGARCARHYLS